MKCTKCDVEMNKLKSKDETGGKTTYYECPKCGSKTEYFETKKGQAIKNDVPKLQSKAALLRLPPTGDYRHCGGRKRSYKCLICGSKVYTTEKVDYVKRSVP